MQEYSVSVIYEIQYYSPTKERTMEWNEIRRYVNPLRIYDIVKYIIQRFSKELKRLDKSFGYYRIESISAKEVIVTWFSSEDVIPPNEYIDLINSTIQDFLPTIDQRKRKVKYQDVILDLMPLDIM